MTKDVTDLCRFSEIDGELLPLTRCACGKTFYAWVGPILSIYEDNPRECPACHRRFYFSNSITILEVIDEP